MVVTSKKPDPRYYYTKKITKDDFYNITNNNRVEVAKDDEDVFGLLQLQFKHFLADNKEVWCNRKGELYKSNVKIKDTATAAQVWLCGEDIYYVIPRPLDEGLYSRIIDIELRLNDMLYRLSCIQ
jgi:hypothetical protein